MNTEQPTSADRLELLQSAHTNAVQQMEQRPEIGVAGIHTTWAYSGHAVNVQIVVEPGWVDTAAEHLGLTNGRDVGAGARMYGYTTVAWARGVFASVCGKADADVAPEFGSLTPGRRQGITARLNAAIKEGA